MRSVHVRWIPVAFDGVPVPTDSPEACRAWIELPADTGWGDVRVAGTRMAEMGYVVAEIRGTGNVLLRLSGSQLERGELLKVPGQG